MEDKLLEKLNIPDLSVLRPAKVGPGRILMAKYANGLTSGSQESPHNHVVWVVGKYSVGFRKPGKEAAITAKTNHKDGSVAPNPDDMTPTIWESGKVITAPASFEDIFHVFERLLRNGEEKALELLAGIFYRSAYLLDYQISDKSQVPQYEIPSDVLGVLDRPIQDVTKVPGEVYLKYLQIIAWNEDVKYKALGYNILKEKTGRQSNLLTYTYLIAVLLGKLPLSFFCYAFARSGGVAPLSGIAAAKAFPWLRVERQSRNIFARRKAGPAASTEEGNLAA